MALAETDEQPTLASLEGASATVKKAEPVAVEPEPEPKPAANDEVFPLADAGQYYEGLWCGKPNYKCPYCGFATLAGNDAVELHILEKIDQGHVRHLPALELK